MKVSPTQYIFPPRAENSIPRDQASIYHDQGWTTQIKYNDTRTLIKIQPDKIELWNRHGERHRSYTTPEHITQQIRQLAETLQLDKNEWHLIDGGLLDQKHRAIKDTLVIWDILVYNSQHQINTTYRTRYNQLHSKVNPNNPWHHTHKSHQPIDIGIKITDNILLARQYNPEEYQTVWETVETANGPYDSPVLEGVVFKNPNGKLELGYKPKNNTTWQAKSRVTTGRHRF